MTPQSFTTAAGMSEPFVHLDERAVVICDGRSAITFERARRHWVAETIGILIDEGRATRTHGNHILGGFVEAGTVTLYAFAGAGAGLAITLPTAQAQLLRTALGT